MLRRENLMELLHGFAIFAPARHQKLMEQFWTEVMSVKERERRSKNVTNDENCFNFMLNVTENSKTSVQQFGIKPQ